MAFSKEEVRDLLVNVLRYTEEKIVPVLKNFNDNDQIQVTFFKKEPQRGTLFLAVPDKAGQTINVTDDGNNNTVRLLFASVPKKEANPTEKQQYVKNLLNQCLLLGIKHPNGDTILAELVRSQPEDLANVLDKIGEEKAREACSTQNNEGWTILHILAASYLPGLALALQRFGKYAAGAANMQLNDGRNIVHLVAEYQASEYPSTYLEHVLNIIEEAEAGAQVASCSAENNDGETVVHVLKRSNPQFLQALLQRLGKNSVDLVLAPDYTNHLPAQDAPAKLGVPATYLFYAMTIEARAELLVRYKVRNKFSAAVLGIESITEYLSGYHYFSEQKTIKIIISKQRTAENNPNFVAGLLQSMVDFYAEKKTNNILYPKLLQRLNDHFQCIADSGERYSAGALNLFNLLMSLYDEEKTVDIRQILRSLVTLLTERERRIENTGRNYQKAPDKPTNKLYIGTSEKPGIFDIINTHLDTNHQSDPSIKGIFDAYKSLREKNAARILEKNSPTAVASTRVSTNVATPAAVVATNPLIALHKDIVGLYIGRGDKSSQEIVAWFPRFYREKVKQQDKPVETKLLSGDLRLPGSGLMSNSFMDPVRKALRTNVDSASKASVVDLGGYEAFLKKRATAAEATEEEKALINNQLLKAISNEVGTQPFGNSGSSMKNTFHRDN